MSGSVSQNPWESLAPPWLLWVCGGVQFLELTVHERVPFWPPTLRDILLWLVIDLLLIGWMAIWAVLTSLDPDDAEASTSPGAFVLGILGGACGFFGGFLSVTAVATLGPFTDTSFCLFALPAAALLGATLMGWLGGSIGVRWDRMRKLGKP